MLHSFCRKLKVIVTRFCANLPIKLVRCQGTQESKFLLGKICNEAGLPKGVLNIVHGLGSSTGQAIVSHPKIKAISFTGGTKTGAHIARIAAPMFKKLSLELGGKNPNIIFADCDFDKALKTTIHSSFANQGQIM